MKELVLKEISKELNWKEKIILKIFRKYIYKILGISIMIAINDILKE